MKTMQLILGIFTVIGLVLLVGGGVSFQHTRRFLATAVSVPGVVTENVWQDLRPSNNAVRGDFYPRIRFRTRDGQEISLITNTGSNPPSFRVNEPVAILYDPQQPYHASIQSFSELWFLPTLLGGMGIIFCSVGLVAPIWKVLNTHKNAWLEQNGRRIQAEFTRVELNTSVRVNGRSPYRLVCQWLDPATTQMHVFHSANIWYDPTDYLSRKTLEVLFDPNNPHRYLVETSFLPKVG